MDGLVSLDILVKAILFFSGMRVILDGVQTPDLQLVHDGVTSLMGILNRVNYSIS